MTKAIQAIVRIFTGMFGERSKFSLEYTIEGKITRTVDDTSNRITIAKAMSSVLGILPMHLEAFYDEIWAMHPNVRETSAGQLTNYVVRLGIPMPNDMGKIDLLLTLDLELTGISDEDLQTLLAEMVLMEIIFQLVTMLIPGMPHDDAGKHSRSVLEAFCESKGIDFDAITLGIDKRQLVGAAIGGSGSEGGGIKDADLGS
jgi:hypothetical protein